MESKEINRLSEQIVESIIDELREFLLKSASGWIENQTKNGQFSPSRVQVEPDKNNHLDIWQHMATRKCLTSVGTDVLYSNYSGRRVGDLKTTIAGEEMVAIPLRDNTSYTVKPDQVQEWIKTYPAIDVRQQLLAIRQWCIANPANRKSPRGALRFITNWLSRAQDRAPRVNHNSPGNDNLTFKDKAQASSVALARQCTDWEAPF